VKLKKILQCDFVVELSLRLDDEFEAKLLKSALRNFCEYGNPIRFNNLAFALRELILIIVARLAPIESVKKASWYEIESDEREVTRKQQLRFCAQGYVADEYLTEELQEEINGFISEFNSAFRLLNKYTHINKKSFGMDPRTAFASMKEMIVSVNEILGSIDSTRQDVHLKVSETVYDSVFAKLVTEVHSELDELSTHTFVEGVMIESHEISHIDENGVHIVGEGHVECSLQYGSSGDFRRGDGTEISDSFPISFEMKTSLHTPNDAELFNEGLNIDNSSWYQ